MKRNAIDERNGVTLDSNWLLHKILFIEDLEEVMNEIEFDDIVEKIYDTRIIDYGDIEFIAKEFTHIFDIVRKKVEGTHKNILC